MTLFYAASVLESLKADNPDQQAGILAVRRALQAPLRQICNNAGIDGAIVVGKLTESKDHNFGFDAQKMEYVDMVKAGIIDPTKVVRAALQAAASVAALFVTTEALIVDKPEETKAGAGGGAGMGGGMGGMGGMDF